MKPLLIMGMAALVAHAAPASPFAESLKGDLVALADKSTHRFDDAALAKTKYFAVYYSAGWCGPCRVFTPKLVDWYNKNKAAHPEFEVIFVSGDHGEADMTAYMATDKMPWPALEYAKRATNKAATQYVGPGIPCLVLLDAEGKVLSDSFVNGSYAGPEKVLTDIEKTLGIAPDTSKAKTAQARFFDDFFKSKTPSQ